MLNILSKTTAPKVPFLFLLTSIIITIFNFFMGERGIDFSQKQFE